MPPWNCNLNQNIASGAYELHLLTPYVLSIRFYLQFCGEKGNLTTAYIHYNIHVDALKYSLNFQYISS